MSQEFKEPDLIIIDNSEKPFAEQETYKKQQAEFKKPPSSYNTFSLRLICLIGFFAAFILAIVILAWAVFSTGVALLSLGRNYALNQSIRRLWNLYANLVVTTLGFAIGIFLPRIGLGLLIFYFAVKGNSTDTGIWQQIFQKSFNRSF